MDGCGGLLGNNHVNVHQVSLSMLLSKTAVATDALSAVFRSTGQLHMHRPSYNYCRLLFPSCILFVSYVQVHILTTPVLSTCVQAIVVRVCATSKVTRKVCFLGFFPLLYAIILFFHPKKKLFLKIYSM